MRVNEFPKESIHKKIFLYSPDNPLAYFQKNQAVYYLFPKYTPDLSCCTALLILLILFSSNPTSPNLTHSSRCASMLLLPSWNLP